MNALAARGPLRIVLFSTLYPSSVRPIHGIFVETRLRELLKLGGIEARVVAPVPWFPTSHPRFGEWAKQAKVPRFEHRNGLDVHHPRYLLPPKVGELLAPFTLARGALPTLRRLVREGFDFDVIDAHYFYPDGVAAAMLAKALGKPFVCTARGSDIGLFRHHRLPQRMLRRAIAASSANIAVCADLARQLIELGSPAERSHVMRNGVDLERFSVVERAKARRELGIEHEGLLLISVGHLIDRKGHDLVIRMLPARPQARLVILGEGPLRRDLQSLAISLGVDDRVVFAGVQPNDRLNVWYSAADALVLASYREGWANVLLEAMACGTPVVATNVNGSPEAVADPVAGRIVQMRDAEHLGAALDDLLRRRPAQSEVRRYAESFSWDETSAAQKALFTKLCADGDVGNRHAVSTDRSIPVAARTT